jgi:alkylation response protein AidB-like acyl-CoA dehydrogenase
MNYEISENEFTLNIDLHQRLTRLAGENNLEQADTRQVRANMEKTLAALADTPYLKFGLEAVSGYNGLASLMAAMEVMADISPSMFLSVEASTRVFGKILSQWGTPAIKEKMLPPLLAGKLIGALALSEESMNVENAPLTAGGSVSGDTAEINGKKQYVINAPVADWIAVAGVSDGKSAVFLAKADTPGLAIGPRKKTLGFEGAAIADITFENCAIPADQVIMVPDGQNMIQTLRMWENQVLIGAGLGLMKTAFDGAKNHAKTHRSGGKPVIAFQEIGFKLSDMLTLYQTSQLFAYRTAWTTENVPADAESLTLCAKVFCTESAEQVVGEAMRILGGAGYETGNPVERSYRCAKFLQIAGTSTEIARVSIGDASLGLRN